MVRVTTAKLRPGRISVLQNLTEGLFFAGRYPELLFLIERNLPAVIKLAEGRYPIMRLRAWISPHPIVEVWFLRRRTQESRLRKAARLYWYRLRAAVAWFFPDRTNRQRLAERLMERLFLSEPFVEYIAKARPYLPLEVLKYEGRFLNEPFLKLYIVCLLKDRNSALYEEIERGQNMELGGRYRSDRLNPILFFFFGIEKPFWAVEAHLYKAVGDAVWEEIERRKRVPDDDPYRATVEDFADSGRNRCPVYAGIRLFDFMVTEGLHRDIEWHLHIMYFEWWTDAIIANMRNVQGLDHNREFPSPYHYLLYSMIGTMQDWIRAAGNFEPTRAAVKVDEVNLNHDTIAKSAAISIAVCFRAIVETPNISERFKGYIADVVVKGYGDTKPEKNTNLARVYEYALCEGGKAYGNKASYHQALLRTFPQMDETSHYGEPGHDLLSRLKRRAEE